MAEEALERLLRAGMMPGDALRALAMAAGWGEGLPEAAELARAAEVGEAEIQANQVWWLDTMLRDERYRRYALLPFPSFAPESEPATKHYGPGPHPGTGTSQRVHGGEAFDVQDLTIQEEWGDAVDRFQYDQVVVARDRHGREVGRVELSTMEFEPGVAYVRWVEVPEDMRRRGIATAMYDWIRRELPIQRIVPLGDVETEEGARFREAYERRRGQGG